jgi:RNA polymerase sigma factor (sigma-70 family)
MRVRFFLEDFLVNGYFSGDPDATQKLSRLIYLNCRGCGFSHHDALDIQQEVLASIWEKQDSPRMKHHPGSYSTRINKGKIIDVLRKRNGKIQICTESDLSSEESAMWTMADIGYDPELPESICQQELLAEINRKGDSLPSDALQKGWMAISRMVEDDLTLEQIAEIMGTTIGTVKSWVSRCRVYLRKELERDGWPLDEYLGFKNAGR